MTDRFPQIIHHGGRHTVTGSCHELRLAGGAGLLVDCGLRQGANAPEAQQTMDFPVRHLCGLVLTHVHIDHVGRLPHLLAAGYTGPIYCSEPSALLLPEVLKDALRIGLTRDTRLIKAFLRKIKGQLRPLPYKQWQQIDTGDDQPLKIRLQRAGHILGSAYLECRVHGFTRHPSPVTAPTPPVTVPSSLILFSGDLGAPYAPLLPAPKPPYAADLVVLESTYGDRLHERRRERRKLLQKIIEKALLDRGTILVPAFSIGRTQELLYELEEIIHRNRHRLATRDLPWDDLEIVVDSPLAGRFTGLYRQLREFWDAEASRKLRSGRHPLSFEQLTTVSGHQDHLHTVDYLRRKNRPCIVIAASGMCSGGRIVNYLKALLGDARTDLLFTGYQAAGTPGRAIQQYGPKGGYVVLDGKRYPIRAGIHTLSGYSAHADQRNLVNFIKRMRHRPKMVRLVHGEPESQQGLRRELERLGVEVE